MNIAALPPGDIRGMSRSGYSLITGQQPGENDCGLQEKSGEANIVSK